MAKSILITSIEGHSGKSLIALGVIDALSRATARVGVFRPVTRSHDGDDVLEMLLSRTRIGLSTQECIGVDYDEQEWGGFRFVNDLERPVFEKFLFLAEAKTWMRAQPECRAALMSGSGSTMFAVCEDAAAAKTVTERAKTRFGSTMWTAVCAAPI